MLFDRRGLGTTRSANSLGPTINGEVAAADDLALAALPALEPAPILISSETIDATGANSVDEASHHMERSPLACLGPQGNLQSALDHVLCFALVLPRAEALYIPLAGWAASFVCSCAAISICAACFAQR